jgi:hypothetical protein
MKIAIIGQQDFSSDVTSSSIGYESPLKSCLEAT